jgi:hypothetical protein
MQSTMFPVALLAGLVLLALRCIQIVWATHTKTRRSVKRKEADERVALAALLGSGLFPGTGR